MIDSFSKALSDLLVRTGKISYGDLVNTETLDRALRAYILDVVAGVENE